MPIKLPPPQKKGTMSLEETLEKRRSRRRFLSKALTPEQLSQLLWAAQGITSKTYGLRTAPSAGATYPLELYLVTGEGLYHYNPEGHELEQVKAGDIRPQLCRAALGQDFVEKAPVNVVIAAAYERTGGAYGQRAARYIAVEAGHTAQNIHLEAVALGLGSVPVGAFSDKRVKEALSLPEEQEPLYIITVGYVAE